MARPVRIRVAGGWYHAFTRGEGGRALFGDDRDREHFIGLLPEMRERFRVRVHAYALMDTHYHLLLGTPQANVSRALQWLNGSYAGWFNRRHDRTGHVFGERFRAVLVENAAWGLEVSAYIHLNAVGVEALGLGQRRRGAERQAVAPAPTPEQAARRLAALRAYRWSSYRAYAGYGRMPGWLDAGVLRSRAGGAPAYRQWVEQRLHQGAVEPLGSRVRWGLVLGGERFARKVRGRIVLDRESSGRRLLARRRTFAEIVGRVERIKGEPWAAFRDRYGDRGRDAGVGRDLTSRHSTSKKRGLRVC
jgi:REP element-mobilizing transposase RayT